MKGNKAGDQRQALTIGGLGVLRWMALGLASLAAAVLLAACVLAWRLSTGPMDVTDTVRALAGSRLSVPVAIGSARLAWAGWRDPSAPLVLTLSGLSLPAPGGAMDRVGSVVATFAPSALCRLDFRPGSVTASDGRVVLQRRADGEIAWQPGHAPAGQAREGGEPSGFHLPAGRVALRAVQVVLSDPSGGSSATLDVHTLDLSEEPLLSGRVKATLASGGAAVTLTATVAPAPGGNGMLTFAAGPIEAATLAPFVPALAGARTSVTMTGSAGLDGAFQPRSLRGRLVLGAGALAVGGGEEPIGGGTVDLIATRTEAAAARASLSGHVDLQAADGTAGPTLTMDASLSGDPSAVLSGNVTARLSAFPIASAGTWWPPELAKGGRTWVVQNLTAGTVSGAAVQAHLASLSGLGGLQVSSVSGGLDGSGVTLHWLRPIAPITDATAHLAIVDENNLSILITAGRQGPLDVSGSRMTIGGLEAKDQPGDIQARIRGPLAAVVGVLNEKRLHLLSRQPIPLVDPSGTVDGRLHVALPLDDRVTMDQVAIDATVGLTNVHLGDVALGHSIDDGRFALTADTQGLTLKGDATFAHLPVTLAIGLDFRAGPPTQVTERVRATSDASAEAINKASGRFGKLLGGVVGLSADYALRRDKRATVTLDADLARASVQTPFGWGKDVGPPGTLHAALTLDGGELTAVDALDANGPDLLVRSHGIVSAGGLSGLALDQVRIGRTSAAGRLEFPGGTGQPFRVTLAGSELDLSGLFGGGKSGARTAKAVSQATPSGRTPTRQPWSASLDFGRVTLARHVDAGGVRARLDGDGAHLVRAEVSAAGPVPATGSLEPSGAGRRLTVRTADAGGLLSALDLTDRVRGGSLQVDATLTNGGPDDGIDGTARLDRFTLARVPAVVRLLRDLTVYGFLDRAPSPGLSVTRVVLPFNWRNGLLAVQNGRAWQPAIGLTAQGTVDTNDNQLDVTGTIVPAYAFNTLPGRIPLLGRLFSPERGGGLFAATFSLRGPANAPVVKINPLAALLPGVLRSLTAP